MAQVRSALRSGAGRVVMAVMLLLGLVTVAPLLSGAASAQRAHLDASVSCDGTVEWTASSWSADEAGANTDVRVHRSTSSGDVQEVGQGSFQDDNGYRFSGHFTWPQGESTIVVSSSPEGAWGNGDDADHDEGDDDVHLERPDCDDDAHVDHELHCDGSAPGYGDGTVKLTLRNPAGPFGHDATFDVYDPDDGGVHTSYDVPAGGEHEVEFDGLSEGPHHIKVTEGGDDHSPRRRGRLRSVGALGHRVAGMRVARRRHHGEHVQHGWRADHLRGHPIPPVERSSRWRWRRAPRPAARSRGSPTATTRWACRRVAPTSRSTSKSKCATTTTTSTPTPTTTAITTTMTTPTITTTSAPPAVASDDHTSTSMDDDQHQHVRRRR